MSDTFINTLFHIVSVRWQNASWKSQFTRQSSQHLQKIFKGAWYRGLGKTSPSAGQSASVLWSLNINIFLPYLEFWAWWCARRREFPVRVSSPCCPHRQGALSGDQWPTSSSVRIPSWAEVLFPAGRDWGLVTFMCPLTCVFPMMCLAFCLHICLLALRQP